MKISNKGSLFVTEQRVEICSFSLLFTREKSHRKLTKMPHMWQGMGTFIGLWVLRVGLKAGLNVLLKLDFSLLLPAIEKRV